MNPSINNVVTIWTLSVAPTVSTQIAQYTELPMFAETNARKLGSDMITESGTP